MAVAGFDLGSDRVYGGRVGPSQGFCRSSWASLVGLGFPAFVVSGLG